MLPAIITVPIQEGRQRDREANKYVNVRRDAVRRLMHWTTEVHVYGSSWCAQECPVVMKRKDGTVDGVDAGKPGSALPMYTPWLFPENSIVVRADVE